jgi:polyisoprenoid-binding protein YceI
LKSKFTIMIVAAVIAGVLAACGSSATPAPATAVPQATEAVPESTEAATTAPTEEATAAEETAAATEAPAGGGRTFVIDQTQSTAHFLIDEILLGQPKLVDGVTNLVEGQIVADYANPAATTVGPITVDLSGLTTDSSNRTGTMHRSILETGNPAYRYAVFTPTKLDGLPASVTIGTPFDFKITGTLDLHGVSKEVTFDATVTPVSETQLSGVAQVEIVYGDWGIQILRLPQQVASVEDTTILKLEFVANAQ